MELNPESVGSIPTLVKTYSVPLSKIANIRVITLDILCIVNLISQSPAKYSSPPKLVTQIPKASGLAFASSGIYEATSPLLVHFLQSSIIFSKILFIIMSPL